MILYHKELQIPMFSEEEIKRRWRAIRRLMLLRQLDCLLITSSSPGFEYVSSVGMQRGDGYCLLPLHGDPMAEWPHDAESYAAHYISWIPEKGPIVTGPTAAVTRPFVLDGGPMKTTTNPVYRQVAPIVKKIKTLGLENGTLGIDSMSGISATLFTVLQKELPGVNWVDADEIVAACMRISSPAELEFYRKANEIAEKGFGAMANIARPGITERELHGACVGAMVAAGGSASNIMFYSTPWPRNDNYPQRYGGNERILQKGDIILGEINGSFGGYSGVVVKPISVGKPSDDFIKHFEISKKIYYFTRDLIRPGITRPEIEAKVTEFVNSSLKYKTDYAFTGIRIGGPGYYLGELQAGMIVSHHPGTRDIINGPTHLCGGNCVVTSDGAEELGNLLIEITEV